jgi:hypothetical protein
MKKPPVFRYDADPTQRRVRQAISRGPEQGDYVPVNDITRDGPKAIAPEKR